MSVFFVLVGLGCLLTVVYSLVVQWLAWRSLDADAKAEQQAIKAADAAVFRAEKAQKRLVSQAERVVRRASSSPVRARYGGLVLHDDHVAVSGATYPLTRKTKARVHGHGRGDQRLVMVLLEDPAWSQSVDATKVGKPNELSAQKFVAEARVRAASALKTREARQQAIEGARQTAAQTRAETSELDAVLAAREQLGERHRGAGHVPGKRWRRAVAPLGILALMLGGAMAPTASTEGPVADRAVGTDAQVTPTSTPTASAPSRAALRQTARKRVARGDYEGAVSLMRDSPEGDRVYVEHLATKRAAGIAERALRRGDRSAAHRALNAAADLSSTIAFRTAQRHYEAANAAAGRARAQRRAAAKRAAAARRAQARALAAERTSPAAESRQTSTDYAGMTCPEIGHSFTVTPGSDPDHDADNDGVACESQ